MTMIIRHNLILIMLVALMLAPSMGWTKDVRREYKHVLKEWTRDDEAYNWSEGLEARMVWSATYLSPRFREAKVERYADLYELGPGDVSRLRTSEASEQEKFDSFVVAIYAGSRVFPDIGKDRSLWKLVLETSDGEIVEPDVWEEIPKNQVTRTLFPYVDRWSKLYEVKFPKRITAATSNAQLKMVGVPADSTLDWDLDSIRIKSLQGKL